MKEPKIIHVLLGALSYFLVMNLLYFSFAVIDPMAVVLVPLFSFVFALFGFAIHFGLQVIFLKYLKSSIRKWIVSAGLGFFAYYTVYSSFHKKVIWYHQYTYPENLIILISCLAVFLCYLLICWIAYSERETSIE